VIDLLAADDRTAFGITAALDIERIPYRRLARAEDFEARVLLIAQGDVTPAATALARRVPTVVIGAAPAPVRDLFAAGTCHASEGPAAIGLQEPIWPAAVRAQARQLGKDALRIPWAPLFVPERPAAGTVLATYRRPDGEVVPAVLRRRADGRAPLAYWCAVDLGAALANLLDERYLPAFARRAGRSVPRPVLALYYRAPERLRRALQRRVYSRLQRRLAAHGERASEYPTDATGWLILELLKSLIRDAAGGLVRLARWPSPYAAAAALTHDLEPSRFAYTRGLERLLARIARSSQPATLGVVARPASRYLTDEAASSLARHDVLCHGLEHRGETLSGAREGIARGLVAARQGVEARLGRRIDGFRSPRLDRSPDLLWALDRAGLRHDSSYPDVDRENVTTFGGGVRLNLPFRPPIEGAGGTRPSACLELPVSAPDCIQPLFGGDGPRALARAVRDKVAFVHATGGLYVGIVHAGVFGPRDAARRSAHLGFVRRRLRIPDLWLASARDIVGWWCARERLELSLRDGRVDIVNRGDGPVDRVRVIVESGTETETYDIEPLAPGATTTVPVGRGVDEGARPLRAGQGVA